MMFGLAAGYGKRLNWPDDYFQFMATLNYQLYMMHDWDYFLVNNGNCHNINLELMLQRNSTITRCILVRVHNYAVRSGYASLFFV